MKNRFLIPLIRFLTLSAIRALDDRFDSSAFCFNSCAAGAQFTCSCDAFCSSMGDCCLDSPHARTATRQHSVQCLSTGSGDTLVVTKCKPGWTGDAAIAVGCSQDVSDPIRNIPVTNLETGITYRNYHCAICNDANDDVTVWMGGVQCAFPTSDRSLDGMVYNSRIEKWGFWLSDRRTFQACDIVYQLPDSLRFKVRSCSVDEVSACDPRWKDPSVGAKCESYLDPVVSPTGEKYRNVHCAACNGVNETLLSCTHRQRPNSMDGTKSKPNFMFIVDFSLKDGNCVGQRNLVCETCDEVWDPFFKKCRLVMCSLPGYKRKHRACVKS